MPLGPRVQAVAASLTLVLCGTSSLQNAVANGDTRTLNIMNVHTNEGGTFTFKKEGRYDEAVLKKLNWLLRDWRKDEPTNMDPQLFDVVWEVYREVDATSTIHVVSGYRSPSTNAMLRSRSKAVAQQSQHTRGRAMDFYIPGANLAEMRAAGLRLQRGGVGFYPTSGSPFVHMDTGSVRHWPRMTREQLTRVFPDGKTIHVPTDGKPMANYELALAEIEGRGGNTQVASADPGAGIKKFFASLFGKHEDEDEVADEPTPASARGQAVASAASDEADAPAPAPAAVPRTAPVRVATVAMPLPSARPAEIAATLVAAQATMAPLPNAPLPLKRPLLAAAPVQVASAVIPPLPAVIVRGTEAPPPPALSFAPSDDMKSLGTNLVMSAGPQPRLRERTKTAEIPFGRLFVAPSLTSETYLRTPELRVFSSFLTAPRELVVVTFSKDPTAGLSTAKFSGEAIASLPTYVFGPPALRLTQRLQ